MKSTKSFFLFFLTSILLAGCESKSAPAPPTVLQHKNGLTTTFVLPYSSTKTTDTGFNIHGNPPDNRSIFFLSLELRDPLKTNTWKTTRIGNTEYRHHLTKHTGGSGGPEYTLLIWKPISNSTSDKGVFLYGVIQSEHTPDWESIWQVIVNASVQAKNEATTAPTQTG